MSAATSALTAFLHRHPLPWNQYDDNIGPPVTFGIEDGRGELLLLVGDCQDDEALITVVLAASAGVAPAAGSLAATFLADHPAPWACYEDSTASTVFHAVEDADGARVVALGSQEYDADLCAVIVELVNAIPQDLGDSQGES